MSILKKYWPHIVAVLAVCEPFLEPSVKVFISQHPHTALGILLGVALGMYHKSAPKDQDDAGPNQSSGTGNAAQAGMIAIAVLLCLSSVPSLAQETNIYAAGVSFNSGASPAVAGTALYARQVSSSGTYVFTVVDALPATVNPFTVTTNVSGGIAQKLFSIGSIPIYVPTSAGVSWNGTNTGWAWSTGGLASIKIKGNWRAFPNVRVVKSSVSGGSGYQPIVGILFGWGK